MPQYLDRSRTLIQISGAEAHDFLDSLITNGMSHLTPETPLYAALLSPQGKYLADFLVIERAPDTLWLDVDTRQAKKLQQRLTMYKLRRPIQIDSYTVTLVLSWGDYDPTADDLRDPRHPVLGWRRYITDDASIPGIENAGNYDLHRLTLGVPVSETDLIPDQTYILEAGFEALNGVDFKKGCFVGQEIVARMKHKTTLRKRYTMVKTTADRPAGTAITQQGKAIGTLFSNQNGIGLAYLNFSRLGTAPMDAEGAEITLGASEDQA